MDTYQSYYRAKGRLKSQNKDIDNFQYLDKTPFEKVHVNFCKYILGTKKTSANLGVKAELGRQPIEKYIKTQAILYWARLNTENINPLLKESYTLSKHLDSQGVYTWSTFIKDSTQEMNIDIQKVMSCQNMEQVNKLKTWIKNITSKFYSELLENKINSLNENNKLFLYKNIKVKQDQEFYLKYHNFETRRLFTKIRISDHNLLIEKGRYLKIPRDNRTCPTCKTLEDENHFLLHCQINNVLRIKLFNDMAIDNPMFPNLSDTEKLVVLLNPSNINQVKKTGSFIKQSLELRTGDS